MKSPKEKVLQKEFLEGKAENWTHMHVLWLNLSLNCNSTAAVWLGNY